jgi:hypothetical protein
MVTELQRALAIVRQLPADQRWRLVEQMMRQTASAETVTLVRIKRFPEHKQRRLDVLADKNTEGRLTETERSELERLVAETQKLALANAQAVICAQRPELFDLSGHPIKRRVMEAVRAKARAERAVRNKHK